MTDHDPIAHLASLNADPDPAETAEWGDAFASMVAVHGPQRARFMLDTLVRLARAAHVDWSPELVTCIFLPIPSSGP